MMYLGGEKMSEKSWQEEEELMNGMTDYQFKIMLKMILQIIRNSKSKEDVIEVISALIED